jgi:crotonobetainyl-CoA:carnitine CoA-transferase CaiB-like acyl-CoA transferase
MFHMTALAGIRVLDLTRLLPGPLATHWMRQMGAEVIKVEAPVTGDYLRTLQPVALFDAINAGKKSIVLDLKSTAGREAFLRLAATAADVVIEGFRPGVLDALGCGWTVLRQANPRLIYVALTGYGSDLNNPDRLRAGHDINYLAMAGVLPLFGNTVPGVQIADIAGGSMQALIGTLGALLERQHSGVGQFVDVSMTHGSAELLPLALYGDADRLSGRFACYRTYICRDGAVVALGALEEKFWAAFCLGVQRQDWIERQWDPTLVAEVADLLATDTAAGWCARLDAVDACFTPVRTPHQAAAALGLSLTTAGPQLGEHTSEVLAG